MTRLLLVASLLAVATGSALAAVTTDQLINLAVSEVAMIGTGSTSPISLTIVAPGTAGAPIQNVSNNSNRLVYTSILPTSGSQRRVTAQISTGATNVPAGTQLTVVAGADAGKGAGTVGSEAAKVVLDGTAKSLVTGIGSAYTGSDLASDGRVLTYALEVINVANLRQTSSGQVTVTLTLTDGGG